MDSLFALNWVEGGWASVQSMHTKQLEDHMPSYFLAEACKYLYLLFNDSFLQVQLACAASQYAVLLGTTCALLCCSVHCTLCVHCSQLHKGVLRVQWT